MIRSLILKGDLALVPLTRGYAAIIDVEDAPLVGQYNWHALRSRGTTYAYRYLRRECGKESKQSLHRFLLDDPAGVLVDHFDGDGLNNKRCNLRIATPSQNTANSRRQSRNTSGRKGVTWHAQCRKWQASIKHRGVNRHLGLFEDAEAAHAAYVAAARELHGEFARAA